MLRFSPERRSGPTTSRAASTSGGGSAQTLKVAVTVSALSVSARRNDASARGPGKLLLVGDHYASCGMWAALPGNCTAECGLRQCGSSSLCPRRSLQTHQLLFYAPRHKIWCQRNFPVRDYRSLRGALTEWGVSGALSIKPHPEAKLCFYCGDTSKHVLPPPPNSPCCDLLTFFHRSGPVHSWIVCLIHSFIGSTVPLCCPEVQRPCSSL